MAIKNEIDPEITAIGVVFAALKGLDTTAQGRVLDYVAKKIGFQLEDNPPHRHKEESPDREIIIPNSPPPPREEMMSGREEDDDSLEGISAVAKKWMRRSGLQTSDISNLFSLGIDEIDLVAKSVPGENKKERMHSVLLLQGIAAYLGSGVARFKHDKVKEACLHYDAFDTGNFARYLKDFAADISGSKDSDYTLTARGISAATELIREMKTKK